jgi:ribosomal protein S6--L-glutamate ligase
VAGVDLLVDRELGAMVLEVNYSPGFRGLETAAGLDIAGEIIDFAVAVGTGRGDGG